MVHLLMKIQKFGYSKLKLPDIVSDSGLGPRKSIIDLKYKFSAHYQNICLKKFCFRNGSFYYLRALF